MTTANQPSYFDQVERRPHPVVVTAKSVLVPVVVARLVVLGSLALAHFIVNRVHPAKAGVALRVHEGLLGWDAGWYANLATNGYRALGRQSLRFFPLVPWLVRIIHLVPGIDQNAALIILANAAAVVATVGLFHLVRTDLGDGALAGRVVWLYSLAPAAFTLVMGYAESTLLVFTVGAFVAMRSTWPARWWWVALAAGAAALTRPLGIVLLVPIVIEIVRQWELAPSRMRLSMGVALVSPGLALVGFLAWSRHVFGDAWLPFSVQTQSGHHGGLSDPVRTVRHDLDSVIHGHHIGTALHLPWIALALVLVIVALRRLPLTYGGFAAGVVLVALSGSNWDSFERYALSAFPLIIAASLLTRRRHWELVVLVVSAVALVGYSVLAFMNLYVP